MSKNNELPSVVRLHCNQCGHETVHDVVAGITESIWEPISNANEEKMVGMQWRVVAMCGGCGHKGFAHIRDHYTNGLQIDIYPQRVVRKVPRWYHIAVTGLNWDALGLLGEIYNALHSESYRLAAMGIRSAFEYIFVDKVGDHGSFKANIDKFQTDGYISIIERDAVNNVLEVGHAAIHRFHSPTMEDVFSMLDILEHLIQGLYVNQQLTQGLSVVPPRKTNPKKNP